MEKPSCKEVKLFPYQDFKVVEIAYSKLNKSHVFELKTLRGGTADMVL